MSSLSPAAGSVCLRPAGIVGFYRIAPRHHGSPFAHSPHGAAPRSDDGERPVDFAWSPCNRLAEWLAETVWAPRFPVAAGLSRSAPAALLARRHRNRNR